MTTQIQTTQTAVLIPAGQPKVVQDFCAALQGPKCLSVPQHAIQDQLLEAMTRLHASFAQQPQSDDLVFLVGELQSAISLEFPDLRTTELDHALRLAATGAYGRPYGKISVAFCCEAIRGYLGDARRETAVQELRELRNRRDRETHKPRVYTADEKRQIHLQGLLAEYQRPYPLNSGGVIYDLLDAMGLITASAEYKKELLGKVASNEIQALLKTERVVPREQRHDIRRQIAALTDANSQPAVAMAKTQLCAEVFAELRDSWADDLQGLSEFLGEKLGEALDANGDIKPKSLRQQQTP